MIKTLATICGVVALICLLLIAATFMLGLWNAIEFDLAMQIFWSLWVFMTLFGAFWAWKSD